MTKRIGKALIIDVEEPQRCEFCGNEAECRPYGPNYEQICFKCGEQIPEIVQKRFHERMDGKGRFCFEGLNDDPTKRCKGGQGDE